MTTVIGSPTGPHTSVVRIVGVRLCDPLLGARDTDGLVLCIPVEGAPSSSCHVTVGIVGVFFFLT